MDRIFLSLKSQFSNFDYEKKEFAFVRTEQQIDKIFKECEKYENPLILYTTLKQSLQNTSQTKVLKKVPCFGILGNLILVFQNY